METPAAFDTVNSARKLMFGWAAASFIPADPQIVLSCVLYHPGEYRVMPL